MIGVGASGAVFFYFSVWVLLLLILWIREYLRLRRNQYHLENGRLFNCGNCHYAFLSSDESEIHLARCPRCNAICIRRKPNQF